MVPVKKTKKESEAEGCNKRPMEEQDGKLVKKPIRKEDEEEAEDETKKDAEAESEAEDEAKKDAEGEEEGEDEEDLTPLKPEEQKAYRDFKTRLKTYQKTKKGVGSAQSPEESNAQAATGGNTVSPGASTPSKPQDKFKPTSRADGEREQDTPMDDASIHKALNESPLYKELSGNIAKMGKTLDAKLEAVAKSQKDQLDNLQKKMDKFYGQSFYKMAGENVGPEGVQQLSIKKQIADGKVRMTQ